MQIGGIQCAGIDGWKPRPRDPETPRQRVERFILSKGRLICVLVGLRTKEINGAQPKVCKLVLWLFGVAVVHGHPEPNKTKRI